MQARVYDLLSEARGEATGSLLTYLIEMALIEAAGDQEVADLARRKEPSAARQSSRNDSISSKPLAKARSKRS